MFEVPLVSGIQNFVSRGLVSDYFLFDLDQEKFQLPNFILHFLGGKVPTGNLINKRVINQKVLE